MADVALEAGGPGARPRDSLAFSFALDAIWLVLFLGLVLRLVLAFFPGFDVDISLFTYWSQQLADRGPWHFYDQDFFTDYAPGYMYVLFFIGKLDQLFGFTPEQYEYILKLPAIAADLASAYLLWRLLEGKRPDVRLGAATLYLLMPPVLLIGPIWGQVDSVLAFFLLLSVYYISKDRPVAGAVAFTLGFLVKPQAIAALPVLAFWIMKRHPPRWVKPSGGSLTWLLGCLMVVIGTVAAAGLHLGISFLGIHVDASPDAAIASVLVAGFGATLIFFRLLADPAGADGGEQAEFPRGIPAVPRLWVRITAISVGLLLVLIFPFFLFEPWDFISHMQASTNVYKVNSFWAENFWMMFGLFDSGFKPDITGIEPGEGATYGVSHRVWGIAMYSVSALVILFALRKKEGAGWLSLGVALSVLAFYAFVTRMHERYMFPVLLPLLAACVLIESRLLWALFVGVLLVHFFNLYHVYMYYNDNWLKWDWAYNRFASGDFLGTGLETVQVLSAVLVAGFIGLLAFVFAFRSSPRSSEAT